MKRWGKVLLAIVVVGVFLIPTLIAVRYVALWQIYRNYVETVSSITGLNTYLVTAAAALLFVPFFIGFNALFSWRSEKRRNGVAILLTLFVVYNLGLFYFTQHAYFGFAKGQTLKWYALTPEGVQLYDRAGVDPKYGIELKPVTRDVVRQLELMQRGEFKPINPDTAAFFNPITGDAQVWYYRDANGYWEFYDKPGFHPRNGTRLQPMTQDLYREWRNSEEERKRKEAEAAAAAQRKRAEEEKARQEAQAQASQRQQQAAAAAAQARLKAAAVEPREPQQPKAYDSLVETTIATWPEDAAITIDSQAIRGTTPTSVRLRAGTHTIVVSKSGYLNLADKITVGSNSHYFTFHLTPSIE